MPRARPEFSFDRPFTASVSGGLVWAGKRYNAGESFPWQQLGIGVEELWELWTQFQIDNVEPGIAAAAPAPASRPAKHQHRR